MYRISCVKYINSLPFIYGLKNKQIINHIDLSLDTPSDCFNKLMNDEADIGLVPVVALRKLKQKHIISSFCIGAKNKVNSVLLISPSKLKDIKSIYLDYQSRTSVELTKVLCRDYWKINPEFIDTRPGFVNEKISPSSAYLVIGDRAFPFLNEEYNIYDLGEAWYNFTAKSFVFACWVANKNIDKKFLVEFEEALKSGLSDREKIIKDIQSEFSGSHIDLNEYFFHNINYNFDSDSIEGMELFLNLMSE